MQKILNRVVIGFVIAILIYALYIFIAEASSEDSVFPYIGMLSGGMLALMVGLQLLAAFFRWVEWHYYLGVIGVRDKISVADSIILQVASFTLVVSPGKAGELLKAVVLKTKTGADISKSAPVVLAERVVDGIAVIFMVALAVVIGGAQVPLQDWQRSAIIMSAVLLGSGLVVVQIQPLAYFFLNLLPHIPLVRRMHGALVDFYESSREVFHLRHVVPMVGVGFGVYGTSAVMMFALLVYFGEPPTFSLLLMSMIIAGVSAAVGALSGSPNGAGVTEGSIQWILMQALGYSVGLALAVGLIHGFFNKWFRVFLGLVVGLIFRKRLFVPALEDELAAAETQAPIGQQTVSG